LSLKYRRYRAEKFLARRNPATRAGRPPEPVTRGPMNGPGDGYAVLACGLARDVVRKFGKVRLRALGTSMVPSILPGDFISIQRASITRSSPGEIVLCDRVGRRLAHR